MVQSNHPSTLPTNVFRMTEPTTASLVLTTAFRFFSTGHIANPGHQKPRVHTLLSAIRVGASSATPATASCKRETGLQMSRLGKIVGKEILIAKINSWDLDSPFLLLRPYFAKQITGLAPFCLTRRLSS